MKKGTSLNVPSSFPEPSPLCTNNNSDNDIFSTPNVSFPHNSANLTIFDTSNDTYNTPLIYSNQLSLSNTDEYKTPENMFDKEGWFAFNVQKSQSCTTLGHVLHLDHTSQQSIVQDCFNSTIDYDGECDGFVKSRGVLRSESDFQILKQKPLFENFIQKSDSTLSLLTPLSKRRAQQKADMDRAQHSEMITTDSNHFKVPSSIQKFSQRNFPQTRTASLHSLRSVTHGQDGHGSVDLHR